MCIGLNIVFSINACMSYFSPILKFSFVVPEPVKKIVIGLKGYGNIFLF